MEFEQTTGRHPWQISQDPSFLDFDGGVSLRALPDIRDERGLAACCLRLKPCATTAAPVAAGTGGQYIVVVRGSLRRDGNEQWPITVGYVGPDEGVFELTAGAAGRLPGCGADRRRPPHTPTCR